MRILLVEDEKGVAAFVKKGLEEENFAVDQAFDGEVGMELALQENYDAIILDVMLPVMDGMTVCKTLRDKGIKTPILMLTAKSEVKDRVQGLDSGADDYLIKPFSFDEFLARVRALLRRKDDEYVVLESGPIKLNPGSLRVFVNEQEINLRPKEYAILEYLLRNKGRIISRTKILENIWGYNYDPNTNIVDVHIKTLRDRLAEVVNESFIKTVRGMGYMIGD